MKKLRADRTWEMLATIPIRIFWLFIC